MDPAIIVHEIAHKLIGIAKDDLTKAEAKIVDILREYGILIFKNNTVARRFVGGGNSQECP